MTRRSRVRRLVAYLLGLFAALVPVAADSVIATIANDGTVVMSRPTEKSQVVSTAASQTVVNIMDREDGWLWILLPPDANGTRHAGWIRASDVEGATHEPPTPVESRKGWFAKLRRHRVDNRLQRAKDELQRAQHDYEKLTLGDAAQPNRVDSADPSADTAQK